MDTRARTKGFTLVELMLVVSIIAIIAAIAIPSLLSLRRTANETSAIAALRQISTVQHQYHTRFGSYGSLGDLASNGYLDSLLGAGQKSGYSFTVNSATPAIWNIQADPLTPGDTGNRFFFVDESGVIRFSESGPAGNGDLPID